MSVVLNERTRLVAVTAASNLFGTRPDVVRIADAAHQVGALVYVDAVHLVPHAPVDLRVLGADLLACSPYKFFGPHLGVLAAAPSLLETLHPDKLLPSSEAVPERFELGTLPYELLAGVTAAVEFIESLDGAMAGVEAHEAALLADLLAGLAEIDGRDRARSPRPDAPRRCCSPWRGCRRPRSPAGSPPRTSSPPPAASTRSRRRGTRASATRAGSGSGCRRTRAQHDVGRLLAALRSVRLAP